MNKTIVIVDPVRYTGAGYLNFLIRNLPDHKIIALWSSEIVSKNYNHRFYQLIDKHIYFDIDCGNDVNELVKKIAEYNAIAYLVGGDSGFILADYLQSYFFPKRSNDPKKQKYRTDKFSTFKYLKSKQLVDTEQFILSKRTLKRCQDRNVVVKPINGMGNKDVYIKPSYEKIKSLLLDNNTYMVQDFVEGPEYCIEICSNDGHHKCTMASLYKGDYIVDDVFPWREENELIDSQHPHVKLIYDYIVPILDCLGIKIGLTWSQIKVDQNNNPHLIEINFRSQGRAHLLAINRATDISWARESIDAYLGIPAKSQLFYKKVGDFNKVCINNMTERRIENLDISMIRGLSSTIHCEEHENMFPGLIPVTKNFETVMGVIIVANSNSEIYKEDMIKINSWKKTVCF